MKASQLARIEAIKMRAEADKVWNAKHQGYGDLYHELKQHSEDLDNLANQYTREEIRDEKRKASTNRR